MIKVHNRSCCYIRSSYYNHQDDSVTDCFDAPEKAQTSNPESYADSHHSSDYSKYQLHAEY